MLVILMAHQPIEITEKTYEKSSAQGLTRLSVSGSVFGGYMTKKESQNTRMLAVKGEIISKFGTLRGGAVQAGLQPGRLSKLLRGSKPTKAELEKLTAVFGPPFAYQLGMAAARSE